MSSQIEEVKYCECGCSEFFYLKEASMFSYIVSIVSLVLFGFWSFFIIPLIFQSTKTIFKRCNDCNEVIEEKDLFSLPSLKDEVSFFTKPGFEIDIW